MLLILLKVSGHNFHKEVELRYRIVHSAEHDRKEIHSHEYFVPARARYYDKPGDAHFHYSFGLPLIVGLPTLSLFKHHIAHSLPV